MKAILFDCDGTLADSFGIIVATMQRVFEREGLAVPEPAAVHPVIGLSLETAIHRLTPGTPAASVPALADRYRATFHEMRDDPSMQEELFAGVPAMLARLSAQGGLLLGMVTGKSRRGVRIIVERHGLDGLFRSVRTADDCVSKPHPAMVLECCAELRVDPADTVVVGDSVYDMQMAVAAGAQGFGVSWGAARAQELRGAGAIEVFDAVPALCDALLAWVPKASETERV